MTAHRLPGVSPEGKPVVLANQGTKKLSLAGPELRAPRRPPAISVSTPSASAVRWRFAPPHSKQPITAPVVHFGLGQRGGRRGSHHLAQRLGAGEFDATNNQLKVDQVLLAEQRLKGSCPFLFTWDGSRWLSSPTVSGARRWA